MVHGVIADVKLFRNHLRDDLQISVRFLVAHALDRGNAVLFEVCLESGNEILA